MSAKVVLIFAIGIFTILPAFNTLYIPSLAKRYGPVFSPHLGNSWFLQKYLVDRNEKPKKMSGSMKVDMKEPLVSDYIPLVVSIGKYNKFSIQQILNPEVPTSLKRMLFNCFIYYS